MVHRLFSLFVILLSCTALFSSDSRAIQEAQTVIETAHLGDLEAMAVSPDGSLIATATRWQESSADLNFASPVYTTEVKLWDSATGQMTGTVEEINGIVFSMAFTSAANGKALLAVTVLGQMGENCCHAQAEVHFYDRQGKWQSMLNGPPEKGAGILYSPTGKIYLSSRLNLGENPSREMPDIRDSEIKIWNARSLKLLHSTKIDKKFAMPLGISADGSTVAYYESDIQSEHAIVLWNLPSNVVKRISPDPVLETPLVALSLSGKRVAIAQRPTRAKNSRSLPIQIWNTDSGTLKSTLPGHDGFVHSLAFSPDGSSVASGGSDLLVKIWNVETGELQKTIAGHEAPVTQLAFASNSQLVTGSADWSVKKWNLDILPTAPAAGERPRVLAPGGFIQSIAFAGNNSLLASGGLMQHPALFRLPGGQKVELETTSGTAPARHVALSQSGKVLLAGQDDGRVVLHDGHSGKFLRELRAAEAQPLGETPVAVSPDDSIAAAMVGRLEGRSLFSDLLLWETSTGKLVDNIERLPYSHGILFSGDGETIIVDSGNRIELRDARSRKVKLAIPHGGSILSLAATADSQFIAAGSYNGRISIWNSRTGEMVRELRGGDGNVASVAFSPDGKLLAAVTSLSRGQRNLGGETFIWEAATGKQLWSRRGSVAGRSVVAFSPDGKVLATDSAEKLIRLWDIARVRSGIVE